MVLIHRQKMCDMSIYSYYKCNVFRNNVSALSFFIAYLFLPINIYIINIRIS